MLILANSVASLIYSHHHPQSSFLNISANIHLHKEQYNPLGCGKCLTLYWSGIWLEWTSHYLPDDSTADILIVLGFSLSMEHPGNWWVLSFPSGQARGSIDDTLTAYLNLWDAMEYFKASRTFSILQFQGIWSVLLWLMDACWPCTYPSLWGAQEFSFFPFLSFWFGFCTTSGCAQGILTALCWKKVPGGVGN